MVQNLRRYRKFLSAARPQPNARLVTTTLVAGMPLWRAALKAATSSPTGKMGFRSVSQKLEDKILERSSNFGVAAQIFQSSTIQRWRASAVASSGHLFQPSTPCVRESHGMDWRNEALSACLPPRGLRRILGSAALRA